MSKIIIKATIKQNNRIQEQIETKGILQDNEIKYINNKTITILDIENEKLKRVSEDYNMIIDFKNQLIKTEYLNIKIRIINKQIEQNKIKIKYQIIETSDIFEYEIIWR